MSKRVALISGINGQDGSYLAELHVDKIKSLGWEPKISLREGIENTYQWYKENVCK